MFVLLVHDKFIFDYRSFTKICISEAIQPGDLTMREVTSDNYRSSYSTYPGRGSWPDSPDISIKRPKRRDYHMEAFKTLLLLLLVFTACDFIW